MLSTKGDETRLAAKRQLPPSADDQVLWSPSQLRAAGIILAKMTSKLVAVVNNPDAMVKAMASRDRLLQAVVAGDKPSTCAVLRSLSRLHVDVEILKVTGLGHILNDRSLWRYTAHADCMFAQALRQKWKSETSKTRHGDLSRLPLPSLAVGFRVSTFREKVEAFKRWLMCVDAAPIAESLTNRLAVSLALHGFGEPAHLVGLIPSDVDEIADRPAMVALLRRAINKMENASAETMLRLSLMSPSVSSSPLGSSIQVASAADFSWSLSEEVLAFHDKSVAEELGAIGIESPEALGPRSIIDKLAEAKRLGANVGGVLADKAKLIKVESSRKNLRSIANGVRV